MSRGKTNFQSINTVCDARLAYNFVKSGTAKVGHLLSMAFTNSGKTLKADTKISDPENPDSRINVVGVFDHIDWLGDETNPVAVSFRLSPVNKSILQEALSSKTGGIEVSAKWVIYDYSYLDKTHFKHFHAKKDINFVITEGTMVMVGAEPNQDIQQPLNFSVYMSLTAENGSAEQELDIAYSLGSPFTRPIGVPVGA